MNDKVLIDCVYVVQTEQMVRVEMKKEQVAELRQGMELTGEPSENYYFLPVSWLTDILKDWEDIKPIDTSALLCRHGKLNWALHNKYKVISESRVSVLGIQIKRSVVCFLLECIRPDVTSTLGELLLLLPL